MERPDLPEHLTFVWRAFRDLIGDRAFDWGVPGRIPWTAMDAYAARAGIRDPDEFERFQALIAVQDEAYLRDARERAKKGGKG